MLKTTNKQPYFSLIHYIKNCRHFVVMKWDKYANKSSNCPIKDALICIMFKNAWKPDSKHQEKKKKLHFFFGIKC